ncbi:DUF1315 domain-containing protein [Aliidiomarina iranensis]|uniref:DUF1315 domain-containing protein n=1 Tax=Aliidiomarina iranensis TaxID=1434071 RepID=A0A432W071_9GAMM|nr:DUF1315 family protein [Aliidiomarina iranensis]RUO22407.1 DUF1315 domain-containing protein [Aliidiomarina iranensis]
MQYEDALRAMTPEIYERMKTAVETGRWPDGQKLTATQLENAMELVMVYQAKRLQQDDHFTISPTGELVTKTKGDMRAELRMRTANDIARFKVNNPADSESDTEK